MPKIRRAIISVYDKSGIVDFAKELLNHRVEIISTGGTAEHLRQHGVPTTPLATVTQFPEILQGRVKTLHPNIFGGLLSRREKEDHIQELKQHGIGLIDLVVVNLYPFEKTVSKPGVTLDEALENIDIGGPSMMRAAAKNFIDVTVVSSPNQYERVSGILKENNGEIPLNMRQQLAQQAFMRTSEYDAAVNSYFQSLEQDEERFPRKINLGFQKIQDLRYGENPHQTAALYRPASGTHSGIMTAEQLHGKALSYNNIIDFDAVVGLVKTFLEPCVAIVKHTNPCGIAVSQSLVEAYLHAKATDPVSAFGGVVGSNRSIDLETAKAISEVFTEIIVAPDFSPEALEQLRLKKNVRIIRFPEILEPEKVGLEFKYVRGCVLLQDQDFENLNDIKLTVVTRRKPTEDEWSALKFGWRVARWVKSNAIVYCTADRTIGIGAGQMSRVDSSKIAVEKAERMGLNLAGTAMASDAFFPFRDGVDEAAKAGASCVIQPGGSIRDEEVIQAANEHQMAMVFTGIRHFRH